MPVTGPRVGTSAFDETGQRQMSLARQTLRLPAKPGKLSEMIGVSKEITINLGANHNYNKDTLINQIRSTGINNYAYVINVTGDLVSYSAGQPCLHFPADLAGVAYIKLIINAGVMGRGGAGGGDNTGGAHSTAQAGGVGITNQIGGKLQITNNGYIAGGGGGGGLVNMPTANARRVQASGGGGRPFGAAGTGGYEGNGTAASLTAPGSGKSTSLSQSGAGGNLGAGGQYPPKADGRLEAYPGGAAGAAVNGNAPAWVKLGTIYGARV